MTEKHDAMWGSEAGEEIAALHAEIKRLRIALEKIKTLKPLDADGGGWGDPYYEMCVSHIGIATEALCQENT